MGGCRCTYKNCNVKSDGKTHMFHYPVFDKVRCHQWLVNAQKLEFLDLKVSQLKNRCVCQHHFKRECFMNYMKDKLTHDAVPSLNGPFCDPSKTEPGNIKEYPNPILVEDIENDFDISDKKSNFTLKYADFLTNNEFADSSARYNRNTNKKKENIEINFDTNSNVKHEDETISETPNRKLQLPRKSVKNVTLEPKKIVSNYLHLNNEVKLKKEPKMEYNAIDLPSDFNFKDQSNKPGNIYSIPLIPLNNTAENFNAAPQINKELNLEDNFGMIEPSLPCLKNNSPIQLNVCVAPVTPVTQQKKREAKIKILSEEKIQEPINIRPFLGNFKIISPSRTLNLPVKSHKVLKNENKANIILRSPIIEPEVKPSDQLKVLEVLNVEFDSEPIKPSLQYDQNKLEEIVEEAPQPPPSQNDQHKATDIIENINSPLTPKKATQIKNKVTPERSAAIEKKRKFNMKLKDIIESCLDKLDDPLKNYEMIPNVIKNREKSPLSNAKECLIKPSENPRTKQLNESVESHLGVDKNTPEYTIAYLEERMKKMESNLLTKIAQNSQQIIDLKKIFTKNTSLVCDKRELLRKKRVASTQTNEDENSYKKNLYNEISKYLSPSSNSLIYEELFINKYACDKVENPTKRRRRFI